MQSLAPYAKSLAGFLVPFAAAVLAAMQDVSPGGSVIIQSEWIAAVLSAVVTGGAVYAVPNRDPQARHQDESTMPPEAGYGAIDLLIAALAVVVFVLLIMFLAQRLA